MPRVIKARKRFNVRRYKQRKRVPGAKGKKWRTYYEWKVEGRMPGGKRERFFFPIEEREQADACAAKWEIAASNADSDVKSAPTHLTSAQLRDAELAFSYLKAGQTLASASKWFAENYREPKTDRKLLDIFEDFKKEKEGDLRPATVGPMFGNIRRFCEANPAKAPHEIKTAMVTSYLRTLKGKPKRVGKKTVVGPATKKTWNNNRADIHVFFEWMRAPEEDREWIEVNPVSRVKEHEIERDVPETVAVEKVIEVMQFAQVYKGGRMVNYFAAQFFAGVRPDVRFGEIRRLMDAIKDRRVFNTETRQIRVTKKISKTSDVRPIKLQPNLLAWFQRFPLDKYPLVPPNAENLKAEIRAHFKLGHDTPRHTFISMYAQKFESIGGAAMQAGNSESVVKTHYYDTFTDAEAELYWSITPDSIALNSDQLAKITAAIAEIGRRKAKGEKHIGADVVRMIVSPGDRAAYQQDVMAGMSVADLEKKWPDAEKSTVPGTLVWPYLLDASGNVTNAETGEVVTGKALEALLRR